MNNLVTTRRINIYTNNVFIKYADPKPTTKTKKGTSMPQAFKLWKYRVYPCDYSRTCGTIWIDQYDSINFTDAANDFTFI